ncbi:MAG: T9SS type A sorting domain-containing protein, partial [Bacteroidota bacterium]|nr:T9SS type A sorting domain-containing protein [Bacteroidota bacterium]
VMFGLELGPAEWDFYLGGYNIYMDNNLHNTQLITDTNYMIEDPGPGTYNFEVSAVYVDSVGDVLCESDKDGPVEVSIVSDVFIIGGNVIAGAYKLDAGEVNLYRFEGSDIEEQYTTELINPGYFFFPEMVPGYYVIHAMPDQNSSFSDSYAPTYKGGEIHWEDITPEFIDVNSYNNDINLVEIIGMETGSGSISGNIYDFEMEIPLANVLVLLLNTENECVAVDYSNNNGEYSFNELGFGRYKLLVEIIGKSMDPIIIILTNTEPSASGISLNVMSGEIVMGIDDGLPPWIDFISEVYPNPARDNATIKLHLKEPSDLELNIYNISGQIVQQGIRKLRPGYNILNMDLQDLNNGVFYLNLELGDRFTLTRKLIKH